MHRISDAHWPETPSRGNLHSDKCGQRSEVRCNLVRKHAEALRWRYEPIHPYRWITKSFCAGGIPSAESDECDLLAVQPEGVKTHLVRTRIGFVGFYQVGG